MYSAFYMGPRHLNSNLHVCVAQNLTTKPFPEGLNPLVCLVVLFGSISANFSCLEVLIEHMSGFVLSDVVTALKRHMPPQTSVLHKCHQQT